MIIKATFKGKDGSLGFEKNKEYRLRFDISFKDNTVLVTCVDMPLSCLYSSVFTFFKNWTNIKTL